MLIKHSLLLALVFQIGWVCAALVVLLFGASINIALITGMIPALWVPAGLSLITRTSLPTALHVHYFIFITISSVAGSAFGVYGLIPHWDTWVHLDSGILLAWFGLFIVQQVERILKTALPKWFTIFVAVATPLAFAALWEITEFTIDVFFHTSMQAGGLEDTVIDMLAAGVGALISLTVAQWLSAPKSMMPSAYENR